MSAKALAWDAGYGIRGVEISIDDGATWQRATLGESLGKYSFRPWQFTLPPRAAGRLSVMARASNTQGTVQPAGA